jgi:membrane-associated protease RseP (regulator of RpoE activity)
MEPLPPAQKPGPAEEAAPLKVAPALLPGTLGPLRPPAWNVTLFVLTFLSALVMGAALVPAEEPLPSALLQGTLFAAALVAILLAHEMGHFLLARRHRVDASWPLFLPAPWFSLIGTFGAVIRLRGSPRTRRALLEIGAAGPIAGFLVAAPLLLLGVSLSKVVAEPAQPAAWTLWDALGTVLTTGQWPDTSAGVELGEPLLVGLCERLVFGVLPAGKAVDLHLVGVAGLFGLMVTAFNLLPLGQLDGGRVLYAVSPRLHRALGPLLSAALLGLGLFTPFVGWLFWGLLTGTVLSHHPPLPPAAEGAARERLGPVQWLLAGLSLLLLLFSFTPVPLAVLLK